MMFSKSFGYALPGILYIATTKDQGGKVQLDEIAKELQVPRHFLGKVMKNLAKEKIVGSLKGPYGGFFISEQTLQTTLLQLVRAIGETEQLNQCVLHFKKCNAKAPCPMHHHFEALKNRWQQLLMATNIADLMKDKQPDFIKSIAGNEAKTSEFLRSTLG